jgi:AraC-like DNA-binding protein
MVASEPTVAARAIAPMVMRVARSGVEPQAFLRGHDIDPALLTDDEARIPLSKTDGLWEEAARVSGDADFGLHLAEEMQASSFGLFSYLAVMSSTLGVAFERVEGYFGLISDASGYVLATNGTEACVELKEWPGMLPTRQVAEFCLAVLVCYARRHLAEPFGCREVFFRHARPAARSEHERLFGAAVSFGANRSAMVFDRRFLDAPLVTADPRLAAILEPGARAELERLDQRDQGLLGKARHVLFELVRTGNPSLETLARRLGVSARTLQRELAERSTSFRDLLGETQSNVAGRLLLDPALSIAEIAALLGFSEVAAFHRSFKRWTGLTPGQYRSEHRTRAPA